MMRGRNFSLIVAIAFLVAILVGLTCLGVLNQRQHDRVAAKADRFDRYCEHTRSSIAESARYFRDPKPGLRALALERFYRSQTAGYRVQDVEMCASSFDERTATKRYATCVQGTWADHACLATLADDLLKKLEK